MSTVRPLSTVVHSSDRCGCSGGRSSGIVRGMGGHLAEFARREGGVFTSAQARAEFGARECARQVRNGLWVPVFRGVYRSADCDPTAHLRLRAAGLLRLGGTVFVGSHATAAEIHGLAAAPSPGTHVIVPGAVRFHSAGLVVHRQRFPSTIQAYGGVCVTTVARTAVDIALEGDRFDGIAVLDAAARLHLTSGGVRGGIGRGPCA